MPQCNLDARGKAVRVVWGVFLLLLSITAGVLTLLAFLPAVAGWIATTVFFLLGILGIYEGRKGWCVMRAMGFKTPM